MKQNRLLINMKNKIEVINDAIDMIFRLKKGETIVLNGLYRMEFCKGNNMHFDYNKRLSELYAERENLELRVMRMGG